MGDASEMSSVSMMSSVESSSVDSSAAQPAPSQDDWKRRAVPVVVICVVILLLIGIALFISSTSSGDDVTDDGGSGGDGNQNPASYSGTPPSSSPPSSDPKPKKATTPKKPVSEPVLCAVSYGVQESLDSGTPLRLPSDGLCDYIFAMGLFLSTMNNMLQLDDPSANLIAEMLQYTAAYTRTELGVGFHARQFDVSGNVFKGYLNYGNGFPERIRHYGCLRFVLGLDPFVSDVGHENMKGAFQVFKKLQKGDSSRKTVLALGLRTCNDISPRGPTLATYTSLVNDFAEVPYLDILVFITSTSAAYNIQYLFSPPAVTNITNGEYISLEQASKFFSPTYSSKRKNLTVGVSLEIGATVAYWNSTTAWDKVRPFDNLTDYTFYFTKSPDKACDNPAKKKYFAAENIWGNYITNQSWAAYYLYENNDTYHDKVVYVRSFPRRRNFIWLLYNIQLTHTSTNCDWDPLYAVKLLKGQYE